MMNKQQAQVALSEVTLSDKELETFKGFTPLAEKFVALKDKTVQFLQLGKAREFNGKPITVLEFSDVADTKSAITMTPIFELGYFYLAADYVQLDMANKSLKQLATAGIKESLANLANFNVNDVVSTGTFPMKISMAAQELGIESKTDYKDINWSALREKYNESAEMRVKRTDEPVSDSKEIRHILITSNN